MKKLYKLFWGICFIIGGIGVLERLIVGKKLLNLGSYVSWGLWVSLYIYLIGLSSGSFLLYSLSSLFDLKVFKKLGKISLLVSLVTLLSALLAIVLDLGHWERFWYVFIHPSPSSMMSWMVWLYSLYFLLILFHVLYAFTPLETSGQPVKRKRFLTGFSNLDKSRSSRGLSLLSFSLAAAIPVCGGSLFGVIGARPYWHSAIFPVIFLFEALLSGISLLTFLGIILGLAREDKEGLFVILSKIILGLLAMNMALELAVMAVPLWGQIAYHIDAIKLVLFGPFWWVFWVVHIGLGTVLPLGLLAGRNTALKTALASGLIVITFMSVRLNIVIPALAIPELKGLESAFIEKRLMFSYVPSFHEWQVSLFIVALAAGLFYLGIKLLPVLPGKTKTVK